MLFTFYIFTMVVGGVVLGSSILLGGKDKDTDIAGDVDADADPGADGDADGDGDGDGDHGGVGHAHGDSFAHPHVGAHTGALAVREKALPVRIKRRRVLLSTVSSIRFWTFFTTFFGLTGVVLEGLALLGSLPTLLAALGMGSASGAAAALIIRNLAEHPTGVAASSRDYVGQTGRVLVAIRRGGLGKVRLQLKGTTVDMLATTDEEGVIEIGELALIIEMRDTTAVIVREGPIAALPGA